MKHIPTLLVFCAVATAVVAAPEPVARGEVSAVADGTVRDNGGMPVGKAHGDTPRGAVFPLWQGKDLPAMTGIPVLEGVEFHQIKAHEPAKDGGYHWLHGVALAWHDGRLISSFGHNKGKENTAEEEARGSVSTDGGKTWGPLFTIRSGDQSLGVSHGVLLSRGGELWSFNGAFYDNFQRTHMRAFKMSDSPEGWEEVPIKIGDGFWPLQEPLKMEDGNWILSGIVVGKGYPDIKRNLPAVAISKGDDLTDWELITIPPGDDLRQPKIWGESTVIVNGPRILNVSRWNQSTPSALAATSEDFGRTWTPLAETDLPMAASKPYAGTLSDGRNYLISSTSADGGNSRRPLTIALSRPGEFAFTRLYVIRHAVADGLPDSQPDSALSYPYAIEHDGKLYVGYSNNGGRRGTNLNSGEIAVIPLSALE